MVLMHVSFSLLIFAESQALCAQLNSHLCPSCLAGESDSDDDGVPSSSDDDDDGDGGAAAEVTWRSDKKDTVKVTTFSPVQNYAAASPQCHWPNRVCRYTAASKQMCI